MLFDHGLFCFDLTHLAVILGWPETQGSLASG